MPDPTHLTADKICFGDIEITLMDDNNPSQEPRDDTLFMHKSIWYVEVYRRIKAALGSARNILEIGVARGGSIAFLHQFFDAERVVGIEFVAAPPLPLERYRAQTGDAVKVYYGIDQADRPQVSAIIQREFPNGIDLVVDDGGHTYEGSKATFEVAFPYLRPGGFYVLEDWNWSHHPAAQTSEHFFTDRAALTNLVFEMIVAHGSTGIIDQISAASSMFCARRGSVALPKTGFCLADHLATRGKPLPRI